MYIYQRMNRFDFEEAFGKMRPDNFSPIALSILFDWYENLAESDGEPFELDVIEICGDWQELELSELLTQYSGEDFDDDEQSMLDEVEVISAARPVIEVPQYDRYTYLVGN